VTRQQVTAKDRLQAARAERRSLLRRLEVATTDAEAEAIRRRLDLVAGEISGLRGRLRELRLRTDYAVVTVTLLAKSGDNGGTGGGSFDDALGDAGRLFVGMAGVIVRVLAVGLPLALLALTAWLLGRAFTRRDRAGTRPVRILVVVPAITATHFTDPACPWAYSARPAHARLRWRFGDQIEWRLVLIGLSESPDAYQARGYTPERLAEGQHRFSDRFGMPFSFEVKPRMAGTARACRAIIAARELDPALGEAALRALQLMQFTSARLLDDDDDLRATLASVPGIDADAIVARIDDPEIVSAYQADRALTRSAEGSPTHAQDRSSRSDGPVRYTAPSVIFEHENGGRFEVGGFQPFEAYDTALANLDVTLERRPAPDSALEALAAFPDGLTTAELASVMRPSDLVDADLQATEAELEELAAAGTAEREPAGGDAVWRAGARTPELRH
jgi:protein-disulfide isomerase-like protein with CxxC motif